MAKEISKGTILKFNNEAETANAVIDLTIKGIKFSTIGRTTILIK